MDGVGGSCDEAVIRREPAQTLLPLMTMMLKMLLLLTQVPRTKPLLFVLRYWCRSRVPVFLCLLCKYVWCGGQTGGLRGVGRYLNIWHGRRTSSHEKKTVGDIGGKIWIHLPSTPAVWVKCELWVFAYNHLIYSSSPCLKCINSSFLSGNKIVM